MLVGTLELQLRMDGCRSLKDKRQLVRSFVQRTRRECKVAIAEVDDLELWNVATVGIACVSNSALHADSILQHVLELADAETEIIVESAIKEVTHWGAG